VPDQLVPRREILAYSGYVGRIVVVVILLSACGRIGFDDVQARGEAGVNAEAGVSRGIDASVIDAPVVTGDGSVAGCHFVECGTSEIACCVGEQTSCVPNETCGGAEYLCGTCSSGQLCCHVTVDQTSGTFCSKVCPL
jgi:hypothetical protein